MGIELSTHPEYEAAKAAFEGALTAAQAASDDTAAARAEAAWERQQRTMFSALVDQQQATAARDMALARAKAQYPGIPETLYSGFQSPEQIEGAAKAAFDFAESLKGPGASNPRTQAPPQQLPTPWTQPPGNGEAPPPQPEDPLDDLNAYNETLTKARGDVRNKEDREKIKEYVLKDVFGTTAQNLGLRRVHGQRPRNVEY